MKLEDVCKEFEGSYGVSPERVSSTMAVVSFLDSEPYKIHELTINTLNNTLGYQDSDLGIEISMKEGLVKAVNEIDYMTRGKLKTLLNGLISITNLEGLSTYLRGAGFNSVFYSDIDACQVMLPIRGHSLRLCKGRNGGSYRLEYMQPHWSPVVHSYRDPIKLLSDYCDRYEIVYNCYKIAKAMEEFLRGEGAV